MKWLKGILPLIEWGRTPLEQSGRGGRRGWFSNLTPTTIFHWWKPANAPRKNVWVLNEGNLPYFAWSRHGVTDVVPVLIGAATVGGVVALTVHPAPAVTATVVGQITLAVTARGALITASAECAGDVLAVFTPSIDATATVAGEVGVKFYTRVGQQIGCVASPDTALTPGSGSIGPRNAVH